MEKFTKIGWEMRPLNMTNIEKIWLHMFKGNLISDRSAMVKFGYGAFRSRVAEMRGEFRIKDRWDEIEVDGSKVRFKQYFIDPEFLKSKEGRRLRRCFESKVRKKA